MSTASRTATGPPAAPAVWDAIVIGAGQAGLSASFHLRRLGIDHLVLDGNDAPGGAWQHRWDSLTMDDVHGVADLPDSPAPGNGPDRANRVVPAWFGEYERRHDLPVLRPVRVDRVRSIGELLEVRAGERTWLTRTLINATGTWTRPFVPTIPGADTFTGEQFHTVAYPGAEHFAGRRVVVVGGGASAIQFLGELAPIARTLWVTRREPVWRDRFEAEDGRAAVALVEERVRQGLPPASVVSVTGLHLRPQEQQAAELGAYRRHPMFDAIEPGGVRWDDEAGSRFEPADAILWATGFRPEVHHLAPLALRSSYGGIALEGTAAVADRRVQLVGYGPSASTIGANRAGRKAAVAVRRQLTGDEPGTESGRRAG